MPIAKGRDTVTLVIAPLQSIMEEQVDRLKSLGFSAVYLENRNVSIHDVIEGKYQFLFSSPEVVVDTGKWRDVLKNPVFSKKLGLIVVDEAHTILQW